jgi:predicted MFS family arabinose efflux permease
LLLAVAAGSVISLPLSGPVVTRFGSRRTVTALSVLCGAGLFAVAFGYLGGVAPVAAGLFVFGFASGGWDVAMNVQGAIVERLHGRAIMSRFHAGFSLGTVAGALLGAAMVALEVPVTAHLALVALAIAISVPLAVQRFVPDRGDDAPTPAGGSFAAWREPRTLLIGVVVLAFAFGEGAAADWIGVAFIDDYDAPAVVGSLGLAAFLTAMTAARWCGPWLLDNYGRVPVVRVLAAVAIAGLGLFILGPSAPVAFVGVLLWGAGLSLGFPVGMSAGADEPEKAASRVSVISSVGYCAFLGGPPLIGFIGSRTTVLEGLTAVLVLLVLAVGIAGVVRPLPAT